jgi:hypothetical protein
VIALGGTPRPSSIRLAEERGISPESYGVWRFPTAIAVASSDRRRGTLRATRAGPATPRTCADPTSSCCCRWPFRWRSRECSTR